MEVLGIVVVRNDKFGQFNVDGKFTGKIVSPATLILGPKATVDGEIQVDEKSGGWFGAAVASAGNSGALVSQIKIN